MNAHDRLSTGRYSTNEMFVRSVFERFGAFMKRRPRRLYDFLLRLLVPGEVRRVVRLDSGLRYYVNPLNHIGRQILERGGYEPENRELFERHISRGLAVLDIGANEGYFTALFGVLTGPEGRVIAVEPQTRLCDLIEINCLLNGVTRLDVFQNAFGDSASDDAYLALYSTQNTGMSSLVTRYHSTVAYEKVSFISIEQVLNGCSLDHVDFVKIDTEGFEAEIIHSLLPAIRNGKVRKLAVDYHQAILQERGMSSQRLNELLITAGMSAIEGAHDTPDGYVIYEMSAQ